MNSSNATLPPEPERRTRMSLSKTEAALIAVAAALWVMVLWGTNLLG